MNDPRIRIRGVARRLFRLLKTKRNLNGVWVYSDNGNPMRGVRFSVWLDNRGMFLSHSRPLVKNDSPYIESFFRTLIYHIGFLDVTTSLTHSEIYDDYKVKVINKIR